MLFQTCTDFFLLLNTQEVVLKNVVTKQFLVPIDFHSMFFPYYGSQWAPTFTKIFFLCRQAYEAGWLNMVPYAL